MGASLARTQLRSIFGELLRVVPDIEAQEPEMLHSNFIHGVKRMQVSFTPEPEEDPDEQHRDHDRERQAVHRW